MAHAGFPRFLFFLNQCDKEAVKVILWYGVVAGTAPGMTAQQAADGEVEAFDGTVLEDGLSGVFATCGCEAARRT